MERVNRKIAIIGGGLRGLTAAYEIDKAIRDKQLPFEYMIIEERARVGGMIRTIEVDGFAVDTGASSFDLRRADVRGFLEELGLSDDIQFNAGGNMTLFDGNEFVGAIIPTYHGLPLFLNDIWHEEALSFGSKIKSILNGMFFSKSIHEDPKYSTDKFLEFRLGREFVDYIAEPYFPENIYGSMELIPVKQYDKNLVALYARTGHKEKSEAVIKKYADGPGKEYTLKKGMSSLVDALGRKVDGHVYLNQKVTGMEVRGEGNIVLELNGHEPIRMGSVIVATNAQDTHRYIERAIADIPFPEPISTSMGTLLFQLDKKSIGKMPVGSGFVIPRKSAYHITKATILNKKWLSFEEAPKLYLLVEFGRRQEETLVKLTDEIIIDILKRELKEILELTSEPHSSKVYRWSSAVPHFSLHQRKDMIADGCSMEQRYAEKGIFLGGNGLKGYDMSNAIAEGKQLAADAIQHMLETGKKNNPSA
ncbi:protoporphyrinogen oxidase [Trichococcus palustris]|uniref:Coproporphyrinogen III oxidase n=1 Tax=Trichococcus palustris TaxID=140314 RepID=A0A143YIT4_9LACT|nr:protoporphyrinogen oxidase [Trichococcus palustris]SFL03949.1 Flavin containing amine oxidoreductase [Trichococcus palustris]